MHPISLTRFNALAAWCRFGPTMWILEEVAWFESGDGKLLGLVVRDRTDGDFLGIYLAKDRAERFRQISQTDVFFGTPEDTAAALVAGAPALSACLEAEQQPGDEPLTAVDFFELEVPCERLHPSFATLHNSEGFSPARGLVGAMMRWYKDVDGNFIEQFQTIGFDARLLELYVYALLVENGFWVSRDHAAPDFLAEDIIGTIAVEVTTANPTQDRQGNPQPPPEVTTAEEHRAYLKQYIPTKFAATLTKKLGKEYWTQPHVAGKPLVFAIQDFHAPGSMTFARTGLFSYLYGYDHEAHHDADGKLVVVATKVAEHRWGHKTVASGFFDLPGAEHVSAVLFNTAATLPKFNRIGYVAGFGSRRVRMIRHGTLWNPDPDAAEPIPFSVRVDDPDYDESWTEGLDVFHNPHAAIPLNPEHFPAAVHHYLQPDGNISSVQAGNILHPLASWTQIFIPADA
ncbi:MAG: hypothetical protein A3E01_19350 [Gammaproteobacteria bacterium RIFCSPHIGHO2_12_FULL_63_22]|nr:MAG: hypothetical protein A3E01_19350 [Gammaproteobacteria bacterium RIFCSPHIGHO2_12_FULL_63_22]